MHAETLEEVKDGLLDACARLSELDIFSSVDLYADKAADVRAAAWRLRRNMRER